MNCDPQSLKYIFKKSTSRVVLYHKLRRYFSIHFPLSIENFQAILTRVDEASKFVDNRWIKKTERKDLYRNIFLVLKANIIHLMILLIFIPTKTSRISSKVSKVDYIIFQTCLLFKIHMSYFLI